MTFISNDPSFWSLINIYQISRYYTVISSTAALYDWVLTFGQEVDLIWRQRRSLMTVLYLGVRYIGLLYVVMQVMISSMSFPFTDASCTTVFLIEKWMIFTVDVMQSAIMITRLYAMYQKSRRILIFLILIISAITIACGVITIIQSRPVETDELVVFDTYQCAYQGDELLLTTVIWILCTVWEVVTLCLATWITLKHFRELPRGWTMGDIFTVLIKTHLLYFASFVATSCLALGATSPSLSKLNPDSVGLELYNVVLQIAFMLQLVVLGPRLVLSVRQHHAVAATNSNEGIIMTSINFRVPTQIPTSNGM